MNDLIKKYLKALDRNIETNPKLKAFKSNDPDFNKDLLLKLAKDVAIENFRETGTPNLSPYQLLDILKEIKKSNLIIDFLQKKHAYITHINADGSLQYVFTNIAYKKLKDENYI